MITKFNEHSSYASKMEEEEYWYKVKSLFDDFLEYIGDKEMKLSLFLVEQWLQEKGENIRFAKPIFDELNK